MPIVSGNVSLYNETDGAAILPTPTIGAVGLLTHPDEIIGCNVQAGHLALVLGETKGHLGQSALLAEALEKFPGAVKAVIAKSFERIHIGNLINYGILPLEFKDPSDSEQIEQGDQLEIPDARKIIHAGGNIVVKNITKGAAFEATYNLSERQVDILIAGGACNL